MSEIDAELSPRATEGDSPLVCARNVQKAFHGREVVKNVNLDLEPGTITVLMGRSGSGKSTLLRLIAGLEEPDGGDIDICGQSAVRDGERTEEWDDIAQEIGMVFQNYTLWPHMNVFQNLALAPRKVLKESNKLILERAERALAEVGMEHHMYSRSTQLSGGERQRVAIARALMMRPTVLLCDEITSALDPPVSAEVLGVISRLKRDEGIACLMVTHDVAFAARAADRFVFFENGEIAEDTTAEKAISSPQSASLREFIGALHF